MLQLTNNTPFTAGLSVFPDENAQDALFVMLKATFTIGEPASLAEEQLALTEADTYYGEPGASSLKYPSDYHTGKAASDIIMLGSACALEQTPVRALDVIMSLGQIQKTVRVFGDRYWDNGQISAPKTFETMRMRYENAFGGYDLVDNTLRATELRNPVGKGFMGDRHTEEMNGAALPNLEYAQQTITKSSDNPVPACFSAVAPNWLPRAELAGTYDENWEITRAPYLPLDYSTKFMNSGAHGLIYSGFIKGGEPVHIVGMHPMGSLRFNLPIIEPQGSVTVAGKKHELCFSLETAVFEPNQLQFYLCWRAKHLCGKKLAQVESVTVNTKESF